MRALALFFGVSVCLASADAHAQDSATTEPLTAVEDVASTSNATESAPAPARGAEWPWAIVGVGGAMVVAAAVTGGLALARQGELDAICSPHSCPPSVEASQAEGRALAFSTDALGVGGLVVGLAGVVLAVALPGERAPAVGATATCGPEGCTLAIGGSF